MLLGQNLSRVRLVHSNLLQQTGCLVTKLALGDGLSDLGLSDRQGSLLGLLLGGQGCGDSLLSGKVRRDGGGGVSLSGGGKCFLSRSNNRSGSRVGHDALNNGLGGLSGGGVVDGRHVVR
jgi:hypothetical protein